MSISPQATPPRRPATVHAPMCRLGLFQGVVVALLIMMGFSSCTPTGSRPTQSAQKIETDAVIELPQGSDPLLLYSQAQPRSLQASAARSERITVAASAPTKQLADCWMVMRSGFQLDSVDHPKVKRHLAHYAKHDYEVERALKRSRPFLYLILSEVEKRGLPTELALLPMVESAFRSDVRSHRGAAGIWQFMPATGKRFGLRQSWWYDGRLDIYASTHAALTYLEYLHGKFDGDWLLAIAAYNAGTGNVNRAIRKNRKAGKPTDFWHLPLPRETRNYIPKLLAMRDLVLEAEQHGLELPEIVYEPRVSLLTSEEPIDLTLVAEIEEIELDRLRQLNPGHRRQTTDPDGPHHLLIPYREDVSRTLEDVRTLARVSWHRHRIQRGETLGHIARRYGTTVSVLQRLNNIDGHIIRSGAELLVPTPKPESPSEDDPA